VTRSLGEQSTVRWTKPALLELVAVYDALRAQSPEGAGAWSERVEAAAESLTRFSDRGRAAREGSPRGYRSRQVMVGAHRLVYVRIGREVLIIGRRHGAMLPIPGGELRRRTR
jgi:plasmid stabilization system protein ParE